MSGIGTAKAALAEAIYAAVDDKTLVAAYVPTQINQRRAVFLSPADDYLMPGETFGGDLVAHVDAYVVVQVRTAKADADAFDDLLEPVVSAIARTQWDVDGLELPDLYRFGDWQMYGTRISLSTTIDTQTGDEN